MQPALSDFTLLEHALALFALSLMVALPLALLTIVVWLIRFVFCGGRPRA